MNRRNRVAFFNILSTVLLRGISIFTAPLFTRLLGTSGYGVTQIYNTWVAVIAIVFTLQTQGTLVNARVEYPEGDQLRYQSSAMSLSTLVYLIFSALVLCFIGPISGALKLSWFLIVLMLIQGFGTFCVNFLNTKFVYEFKAGRNMVMSLVVTLTTLILSIVLILLLPKQINYLGRISAIAVTYGVLGIPVCIWILAKGKTFYNKEYWKFCVVLAIPAVFYNLSDLILGQSDKVMLQQMMDEATVGCYGAALNFGGIMFTLFTALNNSWCPFFFEDMKQGNRENLREKAGNFLELFTVLSAGFVLLASEVYRYVYVTFKYSFLELLDKYRFASEFQKRSAGVPIPPGTHCNHLKINLGKSLLECLYHQFSLSKSKHAATGSNFYCFFLSSAFAIQTVTIESICHVILRKFTNIRFIFTMSILNSHLTDS